jgi:large subunit ribosomal protein L17
MRHRISGAKLNRDTKHRRALYKNLLTALVVHGSIETTLAKAKAIKPRMDKLITQAKKGQPQHRRQIGRLLNRRAIVNRLVDTIAPQTGSRTSGFTRIVKLGRQRGDNTLKARIEFVDKIDTKTAQKPPVVSQKSRQISKTSKTKAATPAKKPKTDQPNRAVKTAKKNTKTTQAKQS